MRFVGDTRGSVGAQKSLLVLVALGILLLVAGIIRMGAQHAAIEAKKELEEKVGRAGRGESVAPRSGASANSGSFTDVFAAANNPLGASPSSPVLSLGDIAAGGGGSFDPGDGIRHDAVVLYFTTVIRPGAQSEVRIPGSGPSGGTGRADIVDGNQIWEVKPARPWWMDGTGQAQLNRYLENREGSVPGTPYNVPFVLPDPTDPTRELVVQSYGQPGMLYYYSRNRSLPEPVPVTAPARVRVPESVKTGVKVTVIGGGIITALWWAGKLLSPACGPVAPLCAVVL